MRSSCAVNVERGSDGIARPGEECLDVAGGTRLRHQGYAVAAGAQLADQSIDNSFNPAVASRWHRHNRIDGEKNSHDRR